MILLRDQALSKCRYFYRTASEWYSFILKTIEKVKSDVYICDLQRLIDKYPKKAKVIRTVDGARRTFFLEDNTVFIVQIDSLTTKLINKYLNSRMRSTYIFIPKYLIFEKFINKSIYNPVRSEKESWIYLK